MARRYSEETKAAVMAALLEGQSVRKVAKDYSIPVGTVKGWSATMRADPPTGSAEKKREIGDLLLTYLRDSLQTLGEHQRRVFRNERWLDKQSASELAVLHGVIADKAIRLLEALGPPEDDDPLDAESGSSD